jgi:hypothetical protein
MSLPIYQSSLSGTAHEKRIVFINDTERPAGTTGDSRLPPGPSLIFILTLSIILWAGIFALAGCVSHYLLHLT